VLSDGKILLAGNIGVSGGGCNVFCLTPSGAINNGWGNQFGQIFAPGVGDGSYGATNLRSLLVLPNDKVMVGTIYHSDQSTTEFGIQRGTSAGLIDAGWGTKDSTAIISPPITGIATPYGGMLQEPVTGNIIVGGWMPYDGTGNGAVSLFRLNASDGSLDTSFGTSSGFTNTHFGPNAYDQTASGSMFYDADGNIVIGGTSGTTNPGAGYHLPNFLFMICRYTSNGIPDTTFSATGAIYIDITGLGASDNQTVYGSLCQADGKYIFCGHYHSAFAHGSGHAGGSKLWVIRTSSAGVLDATFGEPSPVVAQRKTLSTIGTRSSSRKVQH
jgi:uncharacterized delta-60 repeat protein